MHDPVILTDGHTYERRHIEQWLQCKDTSPVSGAKLLQNTIFPNHALRNAIEEYFAQVLGDHREAIKHAVSGLQRRGSRSGFSGRNTTLVHTIDSLMQCSILVNADLSIEHVLTKIMQEAKSLVGAEVASVFLVDRKRNELYSTVNSTGGELRIPIASGVAGSVAYSGMPVIIQHAYSDDRFNAEVDTKTGFKTRNIMCVPLKAWKGQIIGVAQLINKTNTGAVVSSDDDDKKGDADALDFTFDDQQFLEVLAAQAGAAIVNSGIFESMPGVSGAGRWPSPPKSRTPTLERLPSLSRASTLETILDKQQEEEEKKHVRREKAASPACVLEEVVALSPKKQRLVKPLLAAAAKDWEIDTLSLAELSEDKPLSTLGMHLFQHHGLTCFFGIDCKKLENFLLEIERGYPISNQYHNRAHAASVLHVMHCLLSHGGVAEATFKAASATQDRKRQQKLVTVAGLVAAIVHDYEHEGVNNDFLVKTSNKRAIFYNDRSPNENHHAAAAFAVLRHPECNFLENFTVKEYRQLRSLVIDMVLSTDMADHGKTVAKFKDVVTCANASNDTDAADVCAFSEQDALVVLQTALKCADLGHLSLSWGSHMRWVRRLEAEFYAQGDKEQKEGMPEVSFLMDRNKQGASDTQVGFFDFMVLPLFRAFADAFPAAHPMTSAVEDNYQKWKSIQADVAASA
jgi:cAMP-specific phosphodiesterase 4/calcium/calmodulin-dependent 3',5'-cyclic nucleotide phosphodiesterase